MRIKRNKLDAVFSKLVRAAADWTCTRCGKQFEENAQNLHASHIFGRRHVSTRHFPDNVVAHCAGCHRYLGENPLHFANWAMGYLGRVRYDELHERHQQICKRTKAEKEEMYQHYKAELKRIQSLRLKGKTGQIEIVPYD